MVVLLASVSSNPVTCTTEVLQDDYFIVFIVPSECS